MNNHQNYSFIKSLHKLLDLHASYSLGGNDPWYTLIDSKKQIREFHAEVDEMIQELESPTSQQETESEIGDVFWDLMGVIRKLEDEGAIDAQAIFETTYKKFSTRKPYLLTGENVTKEQAMQLWNEAKSNEGYPKDRLWTPDREQLSNT